MGRSEQAICAHWEGFADGNASLGRGDVSDGRHLLELSSRLIGLGSVARGRRRAANAM